MFRLLRADEIDVRVGNTNKAKTKASLLLYKDARCDQNVLDETVGPYNWMRSHSRENANCTVSIWDEKKGQWISKEDTGTESKTEAEKGLASDSFKRACFNWGIGRELYSAPQIWVPYDPDKYERYTVLEIGYDENSEINKLAIANKAGDVVFKFGETTKNHAALKAEPAPDDAIKPGEKVDLPKAGSWNPNIAATLWAKRKGIKVEALNSMMTALIAGGIVKDIPVTQLDPIEFDNLCKAIEANYTDQLKVGA
jgi:hypothetical protein